MSSFYILDDKTYETLPNIVDKKESTGLSSVQLRQLAVSLSEFFGCFMVFGMSLKGEPRVLISGSSGMEHLALKKFAEDVILGESGVSLMPLEEEDDNDKEEEE